MKKWVAGSTRTTPITSTTCSRRCGLHQSHNVVERRSAQARARLARLPRPRRGHARALLLARPRARALDLLKKLAADPYPRVRLEAVRAASFFTVPEAVEVPLISAEHPTDITSTSSAARR